MNLDTWICGSCNVDDEYNPFHILRDPLAREIIWRLNAGPATAVQLAMAIGREEAEVTSLLTALERTNAITSENQMYQLAFSVFTAADRRVVWKAATDVGIEIADHLAQVRPALAEIVGGLSSAQYVGIDRLLLAIVGCFALDWGSLERLGQLGYLARHKTQPGGGNYILFAAEPGIDVKRRLCYSHNYSVDGYIFTTFGDITGDRDAFPDLLWRLDQSMAEDIPFAWNQALRQSLQPYLDDLLRDAACLLENLARESLAQEVDHGAEVEQRRAAALFPLLLRLGYVRKEFEDWRPAAPVFLPSDKTLIETAVSLITDEVETVVAGCYDWLQQALRGISPLNNGVPLAEVFTEVWHFIFAEANRVLIESGFMASPARTREGSARFTAWLTCPAGKTREHDSMKIAAQAL